MWKQLTDWLTQMIVLAREAQRNSDDIKQMRREIDDLTRAFERFALKFGAAITKNVTNERN